MAHEDDIMAHLWDKGYVEMSELLDHLDEHVVNKDAALPENVRVPVQMLVNYMRTLGANGSGWLSDEVTARGYTI